MVWTRAARCRAWLRERVAALLAAGDLDRGGAGVAGVVVGVCKAGDVAAVAEDLGGQDFADAEDLRERGAGGGDGLGAAAAVVDEGAVDATEVGDELAGHRLAFDVDRADRPDGGQQAGGAVG